MHKKEASQVNYAVITVNVWGVGDDAKAIKQTFFSQKHTEGNGAITLGRKKLMTLQRTKTAFKINKIKL